MANSGTPWLLILVVAVLGYFVLSGTSPFKTGGTATGGGTNIGDTNINVPPVTNICDSGTSPDLSISAFNGENTANTYTGNYSWRIKGTTAWRSQAFGTTLTNMVSPNDVVEVLAGVSNVTPEQNFAHGNYFELTVPCQSTVTRTYPIYFNSTTGDVTFTFYDQDGTANSNESLNANAVKTVQAKWTAKSDTYIGNPFLNTSTDPYPNRVCIQLNATGVDSIDAKYAGVTLSSEGTPTWLLAANGTSSWRCWEAPVVDDKGTTFSFTIDVGATSLSGEADETAAERNMTLIGASYYIDDFGAIKSGVQDDNGAKIGSMANTPARHNSGMWDE